MAGGAKEGAFNVDCKSVPLVRPRCVTRDCRKVSKNTTE
jgi:hypothetical protein